MKSVVWIFLIMKLCSKNVDKLSRRKTEVGLEVGLEVGSEVGLEVGSEVGLEVGSDVESEVR